MKRVGRSFVSAITHTPASGPFGLVTTPPRSLSPMLTPAGAGCCAWTCAGGAPSSTANAATPSNRPVLMVMTDSSHPILGNACRLSARRLVIILHKRLFSATPQPTQRTHTTPGHDPHAPTLPLETRCLRPRAERYFVALIAPAHIRS